jgi:hypothetical protein
VNCKYIVYDEINLNQHASINTVLKIKINLDDLKKKNLTIFFKDIF